MACGGMDTTTFQRYNWQDEWCNIVNWQQFTLSSVQTAMFTPDHSAFAGSRVVATILRQFGEQFSGDMQVLPLPPGIPPEISRVVLKSSDGSQEVNAGPARFNYVWNRIGPDGSLTQRAITTAFHAPHALAAFRTLLRHCTISGSGGRIRTCGTRIMIPLL